MLYVNLLASRAPSIEVGVRGPRESTRSLILLLHPDLQAIREWTEEHIMDVPFEWEEKKMIDPAVYQEMAKAGLLTALAFGHRVPKKWAKKDGTVFAGVKAEDWDGL